MDEVKCKEALEEETRPTPRHSPIITKELEYSKGEMVTGVWKQSHCYLIADVMTIEGL